MYPELEIFLYRRGEAEFAAMFRLHMPGVATDQRFEAEPIRLDLRAFDDERLLADPAAYGLKLGRAVFDHPLAANALLTSASQAAAIDQPLRVRLCTDQRSLKLHRLRWETLRLPAPAAPDDPAKGHWLIADNRYFFSRHLFSGDMRPVRLRPKSALKALIAVANPSDLARYQLPPIDVGHELQTARDGLRQLEKAEMSRAVTLDALLAALRKEPDVLYLACHGALTDGEPHLLLEADDGTAEIVSGSGLVDALKALVNLPRLVILVSCQSGGTAGEKKVLAALGPRLAEAGVAAVLAMQGDLRMDTARDFFVAFFESLQENGQVDEATTHARAAVANAADAWVPVLYTRLVEGRIWYNKGLAGTDDPFRAWRQLALHIREGQCVPILGSGVLEPFLGGTRELANELARDEGYPLALSGREDLPQITQFMATMSQEAYTRTRMLEVMRQACARRWPDVQADPELGLRGLLTAAWDRYRADNPFEPHSYLARLGKFKTVITTNPDDLMETAFVAAGRRPRVHLCRWDDDAESDDSRHGRPSEPTAAAPFLYQLFGHLGDPESVILTEDDYFRFLTQVTRRQAQPYDSQRDDDLINTLLRGTLARSALLFLGFRVTDWDFRTLFRLLTDQSGRRGRSMFTHIAVQIDPETGAGTGSNDVRHYVEALFGTLAGGFQGRVAVYWGSPEDFLKDLDRQWNPQPTQTPQSQHPLTPPPPTAPTPSSAHSRSRPIAGSTGGTVNSSP